MAFLTRIFAYLMRSWGECGRRCWISLLFAVFIAYANNTATANTMDEATLKAAFLRNFIEFVTWPTVSRPLNVCTLGQNSAGPAFESLNGRTINGNSLAVRRVDRSESTAACDVVYVPSRERGQLNALLLQTQDKPVLVVADIEGAAQLGATLSLHDIPDGRVGFDVNITVARAARLHISSRLIQLARRVY